MKTFMDVTMFVGWAFVFVSIWRGLKTPWMLELQTFGFALVLVSAIYYIVHRPVQGPWETFLLGAVLGYWVVDIWHDWKVALGKNAFRIPMKGNR